MTGGMVDGSFFLADGDMALGRPALGLLGSQRHEALSLRSRHAEGVGPLWQNL
jgi:hypothetical protein